MERFSANGHGSPQAIPAFIMVIGGIGPAPATIPLPGLDGGAASGENK
jgi:hypothetical protein